MTSAANQDAYGPRGWNQGPWGNTQGQQWQQPTGGNPGGNPWPDQAWAGPPFWHPAGISRPMAIVFTVLGFIFWWPVGLAMLFYMIGSGRMGCFGRRRRAMNQQDGQDAGPWANWKVLDLRAGRSPGRDVRQPRLRRIQGRDPSPHGGRAEGIRIIPRTPALRQGQGRVRPVHGRAPVSPAFASDGRAAGGVDLAGPIQTWPADRLSAVGRDRVCVNVSWPAPCRPRATAIPGAAASRWLG